jgi:hypothetical protein
MMFPVRKRPIHCCSLVVGLSAGLLGGCSLPQIERDVWRQSTIDIVETIRCEAKKGLGNFRGNKHEERIVQNTKIAYDFSFDVEGGYSTGSGTVEFRGTPLMLNLSAGLSQDRVSGQNTRDFLIVEDLETLSKAVCPKDKTPANWVYPIVGSIGMDELVRTYIKLEKLTDLATGSPRHGAGSDVFVDALTFTTELNVGATATIELNTVAGSFRLTRLAPFGNARRTDVHTVTVALARDPLVDPDPDEVGSSRSPGERPRRVAERPDPPTGKSRALTAKRARQYVAEEKNPAVQESKRVGDLVLKDATPGNRLVVELLRRRNLKEDGKVVERVLRGPLP